MLPTNVTFSIELFYIFESTINTVIDRIWIIHAGIIYNVTYIALKVLHFFKVISDMFRIISLKYEMVRCI